MNLEALKKTIALMEQDHSDSGIGFNTYNCFTRTEEHPRRLVASIVGFTIAANNPALWGETIKNMMLIDYDPYEEASRLLGFDSQIAADTLFMDGLYIELVGTKPVEKKHALGVLRELRDILEKAGEPVIVDPEMIRCLWEKHIERKELA